MSCLVERAREEGVLTLTLNRPERRNALSRGMIAALTEAVRGAELDPGVRVVVLTGTPPAFCAGLDLSEVACAEGEHYDTSDLSALYELIDTLPRPVVVAINGAAVAGGAVLACVGDIVLISDAARIGFPGIRRGIFAPIVMPYVLRAVGERRARALLLTGELLGAERAERYGLADEVLAGTCLMERTGEVARTLAACPVEVVVETKRTLRDLRSLRGADFEAASRGLGARVPLGPAGRGGIERFLRG